MLRAALAQALYRMTGADQQKINRLRDHLVSLTKGEKASDIRGLIEETIEDIISPLVYVEALDLMDTHREQGRPVVLLSVSPEEVVRPLAAHLGIEHFIATRSEIDEEGRYVGELAFYASGEAKAESIRELARDQPCDLADCYAYSDSVTDLPMLEAVGHPVAVNPDRELRAIAEERDWPILRFAQPVTLRSRLAALPRPVPLISAAASLIVVSATVTFWLRKMLVNR